MGLKKKVMNKGKPILQTIRSKLGSTAGILKAGAKVAKVTGTAGAVITGLTLLERAAEKAGIRGGAGFIGKRTDKKKRRRGKVPKTVKKWAKKIVSRRKQEETIVKDLFGTSGGKVIKAPKKSVTGGSISRSEALSALRD